MATTASPIWTQETVYAAIKTFVLAEHRLPSVRDYEARSHGLPSNSGTVYRACKEFKALLARDGIAYTVPPSLPHASHPWRKG